MAEAQYDALLEKLGRAISPYKGQITIIGGICFYLYFKLEEAAPLKYMEPVFTKDIDLGYVPTISPESDIFKSFTENGFKNHSLMKGCSEEVTKFSIILDDDNGEFTIEFLAPKIGNRGKGTVGVQSLQTGAKGQEIRYLDIAILVPLKINVSGHEFQIANPASFVVQKCLSQNRKPHEASKDFYYIFSTLILFRNQTEDLKETWIKIKEIFPNKWSQKVIEKLKAYWLSGAESEGIIAVEELINLYHGQKIERQLIESQIKPIISNIFDL